MKKMTQLRIEHNHGVLILKDVTLLEYEHTIDVNGYPHGYKGCVAKGTVVEGYTTNRLFHATSTDHETPGAIKSYDIYGRKPYVVDVDKDYWAVSVVNCG